MVRSIFVGAVAFIAASSMSLTPASAEKVKRDKYHEVGNTRIVMLLTAPKTGYQTYKRYLDSKKIER
jgi:hypothetical protein